MYLPFGSALLRFLQLPLSLNSDQPATPHSAVADEQLGHHRGYKDLGNLSPYHDAPAFPEVSPDLPGDCAVDQVILLHRHGSRGPAVEQKYILHLVATLDRARDVIRAADLPQNLQFLKEGYEYDLVPEELTIVGRKQLFDHGVRFALRYPTLSTDVVVASTSQRAKESSYFFGLGFFGLEAQGVDFLTTADFHDPVSWLRTWKYCPKLSYTKAVQAGEEWAKKYITPMVVRFNEIIPGVNFTMDDIRGALYACPYDLAARDKSPWCDVFTKHELQGLEYELDLLFDGITGHGSKGDPGPLIGVIYVKKLIERLTNSTGEAEPLHLEFAHDLTVLFAMSTMSLNKDSPPLNSTHPPRHRKFRMSYQTPFAAEMTWEKFTCETSFEGPQVRLVLNEATFPLSICERSERDRRYGTCSLAEFVRANAYSLGVAYHDEVWNATCERQG